MPFYLLGFFLVGTAGGAPVYYPQCGGRLDSVLRVFHHTLCNLVCGAWLLIPLALLRHDLRQYYYLCFVMFVGMTTCLLLYVDLPQRT